jgi:hypothetical protein
MAERATSRQKLDMLAESLYRRWKSGEGIFVPRERIAVGSWQPRGNDCHINVSTLAEYDPTYRPVRGWLCADYLEPKSMAHMKFFAHSVTETPEGQLIDITPNPLPWRYRFLCHQEGEEDFGLLVGGQGIVNLVYFIGDHRRKW